VSVAATTRAPGFWDWTLDPALALVLVTVALYLAGGARSVAPVRARSERRWQAAAFMSGLALLAIALDSPLESLSRQLFWAHMVQHVLLLMAAPPLIMLARPWMRLWRALPLDWRRSLARALGSSGRLAWLRSLGSALGRPLPSLVLFCGVLVAWHVPALFDATLRTGSLHALEHFLFFATALMFWKQVIHSPPLRARLAAAWRIVYVIAAMVVSWVLAVVLALAPHALYAHYAHEAARPGGLTALGDQQIAAGVMWVPGSIAFVLAIFVHLHRWLAPPPPAAQAPRLPAVRST
jgi:putative membrane protein